MSNKPKPIKVADFKLKHDGLTLDFSEPFTELDMRERNFAAMFLARLVLEWVNGDNQNDHVLRNLAHRILHRDPKYAADLKQISAALDCIKDRMSSSPVTDLQMVVDRLVVALDKMRAG
jgi:hypothetical protein